MKQSEIINLINLNNLNSINYLFNHNKSNIESLIKEVEQITGCNLRGRSTSERTYYAYERTYLEPEEVIEANKNKELPGQENNTNIKQSKSSKSYYTEIKTNRPGYIDAHIENTYESGEKYYHLMKADKSQSAFITKFYDRPITTICFTDTDILYIPSNEWMKIDKKSLECFIKAFRIVGYDLNKYNESIYFAIYKPTKFDVDADTLSELIKSRELTLF